MKDSRIPGYQVIKVKVSGDHKGLLQNDQLAMVS